MTDCMVLCFGMLLATIIAMMPLQPQNIPIMPWMEMCSGQLLSTCFKCFFCFCFFFRRASTARGGRSHKPSSLLSPALRLSQRFPVQDGVHDPRHHRAEGQRRWLISPTDGHHGNPPVKTLIVLFLSPRVHSPLVLAKRRHLQLLRERQELQPQRRSEDVGDCVRGRRPA